jgi:rhomboid protease GluP
MGTVLTYIKVDGIQLIYFVVQVNSLVSQGFVWQLVTSAIFVYGNLLGLLDAVSNIIALYFIDPLISPVYSRRWFYGTFFSTAVFGNILSYFFYPPFTVSFGASGGIFGLLGGAVSFDYFFNRKVNTYLLAWFLFVFIISTYSTSVVDVFAHAGGTLLGLLIGAYLGNKRRGAYLHGYEYRWRGFQ